MSKDAEYLLEKYVEGKDQNKFSILEDIYKPDAKVTFEIESDGIAFPAEISGNKNIARVLSADFNRKYDHVQTYYLSHSLPQIEDFIFSKQEWLVIMREKQDNHIRVGAGFYDWIFEKQADGRSKIAQHNIFIGVMLGLPDRPLSFLDELQGKLPYPWVDKEKATEALSEFNELQEVCDYLKNPANSGN